MNLLIACLVLSASLAVSVNAQCTTVRVRKNIKNLTPQEKTAMYTAFNTMYKSSTIQKYVSLHMSMNSIAHNVPEFLARHRIMTKQFEDEFVAASGGGISGLPYWDSMKDASNPRGSIVLTADYMGTADAGCIKNGPSSGWVDSSGNCVRRGFTGGNWASDAVVSGIASVVGSYSQFSSFIETSSHALTHNGIGGNMADLVQSPWDSMFYIHHCAVDLWWAMWQSASTANANSYDGKDFNMNGVRARDSVDYKTNLCYQYDVIGGSSSTPSSGNGNTPPNGNNSTGTPNGSGANNSTNTSGNSTITVPDLNSFSDGFLKSFNVSSDKVARMQPIFAGVATFLKTQQMLGKTLPTLADLKNLNFKMPQELVDQIQAGVANESNQSTSNENSASGKIDASIVTLATVLISLVATTSTLFL